ncbi:hypothetical protein, partial [Akkermansia sp.]|uniref:hypothetical protein n=1 Tax=Akkermansia sp. TaxID=1872421 RepID=UPI003AB5B8F9
CDAVRLCGISSRFQLLSPCTRQVTHALLTRPPLSHKIISPEGNIHKAQFVLSDETYNPTLPFTFIYPLFAMLLFVGGIGYARQNRKINIATYSLFLKKPQTKPWFLKL